MNFTQLGVLRPTSSALQLRGPPQHPCSPRPKVGRGAPRQDSKAHSREPGLPGKPRRGDPPRTPRNAPRGAPRSPLCPSAAAGIWPAGPAAWPGGPASVPPLWAAAAAAPSRPPRPRRRPRGYPAERRAAVRERPAHPPRAPAPRPAAHRERFHGGGSRPAAAPTRPLSARPRAPPRAAALPCGASRRPAEPRGAAAALRSAPPPPLRALQNKTGGAGLPVQCPRAAVCPAVTECAPAGPAAQRADSGRPTSTDSSLLS